MRQVIGIIGSCVAVLCVISGCSKPPEFSGHELFAANCESCHGRYGEGDGPAAADTRSIPDLRYLAARNGGAFPRDRVADLIDGRQIIKAHGDRQMPVWGEAFASLDDANGSAEARTAARIQALVDFLVGIQQHE